VTSTGSFIYQGAGTAIPDGNGGTLATSVVTNNANQTLTQVTDVNGSGATATLANLNYYTLPDIVLGDQGTYFISDGNQIVNINESSGSELWRWQPSSGTVQIVAATAGGGIAVRNIVGGQEDVVRLDTSGNPTYDTWGTSGGSAGFGVISNISYTSNGLWSGTTGDPVISSVIGDDLLEALNLWVWGHGEGSGDKQGQSEADPALKLVGIRDCTTSGGSPLQYERSPSYKLETAGNQTPTANYTVFEFLTLKNLAQCKDAKGNPTGSSPCTYIGGNRFDDQLFVPAQSGSLVNVQSFRYGLSGKRLWEVHRIERTAKSLVTLQQEQVATDNVDHLNLSFAPLQEPLIDGYTSPYIGPNCSSPPMYPWAK